MAAEVNCRGFLFAFDVWAGVALTSDEDAPVRASYQRIRDAWAQQLDANDEREWVDVTALCELSIKIARQVEDADPVLHRVGKSNLLYRLVYRREQLRMEMCKRHMGQWSGCQFDCVCECQYLESGQWDSNVTGWLPTNIERLRREDRIRISGG